MIEWKTSVEPVAYPDAISQMEQRVAEIAGGKKSEQIWLLEHPDIYTAGTSANLDELLNPDILPIYETGRGGKYTYHGAGQRIGYVMLDLKRRKMDIRSYLVGLENWLIATLAEFGISARADRNNVGIWVGDAKIAAIGIRIRGGVTYHGFALNVSPDLSHYKGIIPCGIRDGGVTSMRKLGVNVALQEVDKVLRAKFTECFI